MANRIILPKYNVEIEENPIIFFTGPVGCAGGWQNNGVELIRKKNSEVYIAIPDYAGILNESIRTHAEKSFMSFPYQLDWEQNYLEKAEKQGVILFWLPKQKTETAISTESGYRKCYARDSRPETGGWGWGLLRHKPNVKIVIGGEEGFEGLSVVRRNFTKYAPQIPFRNNLEDVCNDALRFL